MNPVALDATRPATALQRKDRTLDDPRGE